MINEVWISISIHWLIYLLKSILPTSAYLSVLYISILCRSSSTCPFPMYLLLLPRPSEGIINTGCTASLPAPRRGVKCSYFRVTNTILLSPFFSCFIFSARAIFFLWPYLCLFFFSLFFSYLPFFLSTSFNGFSLFCSVCVGVSVC